MIIRKLRGLGLKKHADLFTMKIDDVIKFLIERKFTISDMAGKQWFTHELGFVMYGN